MFEGEIWPYAAMAVAKAARIRVRKQFIVSFLELNFSGCEFDSLVSGAAREGTQLTLVETTIRKSDSLLQVHRDQAAHQQITMWP